MLKIRRPLGIAIPGKTVFLIETAPRQQDITRTNGDPDLYHHMATPGHNDLNPKSGQHSALPLTCLHVDTFMEFLKGFEHMRILKDTWTYSDCTQKEKQSFYCTRMHADNLESWWSYDMEMLSTLLALCEGNPPVTSGFPSQRASNEKLWCFICC